MAFKLTVDSFLECLAQSGLVDFDRCGVRLVQQLSEKGVDVRDPHDIADALVRDQTLTAWQAENLLRGKRRGFLLGKYRLLSLLGRGGMNAVFLAEHTLMRRRCAIKILPAKNLNDPAYLDRFYQEARAVATLDHTNIVRAYDIGKGMDGRVEIHFFAMEFVDGESLDERASRHGPLPIVDAANLIRQAADGLAHAHQAGIVHRDVKPANLLVDRDGVVKILDLGLAKFFSEGSPPAPNAAKEQWLFGTADYLSPEQALDGSAADARSDIYSLGCTFYFLLAGHAPFPDGTLPERLVSHQTKEPVSIARKRSDVPRDLVAILEKMLAKKPTDRFQKADNVSEALRQWLVQHADRNWLQANPAVLSGGKVSPKSDFSPAVEAPDAVLKSSGSSDEVVNVLSNAITELKASPTAASSILYHPGMSHSHQPSFRQLWKKFRSSKRAMIASGICLIGVAIFVGWWSLLPPSSPSSELPTPSPISPIAKPAKRPSRRRRPVATPPATQLQRNGQGEHFSRNAVKPVNKTLYIGCQFGLREKLG